MSKEETTTTAVVEKTNTAVAERTNIARLKGSWKERIERMLPDPKMIDQFMYCAEVQYGKNREAMERCTPVSLLNCMLTCAKYGILPDGRNAYLIPYGTDCTVQFDYKGLVHVVVRDGIAKKVQAEVVCANDKFEWVDGKVKRHEINLPRGQMLGAYCIITLENGEEQHELMDIDDIETIKSCSKGSNSPSSPWNKFYKEMAKKSVFRRCTKWIKMSPDVMDAIRADDEGYDFEQSVKAKSAAKTLFQRTQEEQKPVKEDVIDVAPVDEEKSVQDKITDKKAEEEKKLSQQGLPF